MTDQHTHGEPERVQASSAPVRANGRAPLAEPQPPQPPAAAVLAALEDDSGGIADIRYYFHLLWHHKWAIMFCALAFVGWGALQLRKATPIYGTFSTVRYEPSKLTFQDLGSTQYYFSSSVDEMQTAVEMIRSPKVARAVIDAMGLFQRPEPAPEASDAEEASAPAPTAPSPIQRAWAFVGNSRKYIASQLVEFPEIQVDPEIIREQNQVKWLLSKVWVRQREGTSLLDIKIVDPDPAQASRLADEFANQFILDVAQRRQERLGYASNYYGEQIDRKRKELEKAERARHEFNAKSELKAMTETHAITRDTVVSLQEDIENLGNEIVVLEASKEAADSPAIRRTLVSEDAYYNELSRKLNDLEIERISLAADNQPDYQPLRKVQLEIQAINAQLTKAADDIKLNIEGKLQMQSIRLDHLKRRLEEQKDKLEAIENQMIEFRLLDQEVERESKMFEGLLNQYQRLDVADDDASSNVVLVASADVPTLPESPKITATLSRYAFMGGALGVGLAFLLAWLDRSVKNPAAVEDRLKLPTLGMIPYLGPKSKLKRLWRGGMERLNRGNMRESKKSVVVFEQGEKSTGMGPETFRYLRTSLLYSSEKSDSKTLLVTSTLPSEGKSTVSSNLAASMAERGERVLLIDADLRRPNVHRGFGIERMPGLSDVLIGAKKAHEAIVTIPGLGLDVLPAGETSPSPLNLLDSDTMANLLAELRGRYSTIVIDSAPCYALADSLVLASLVDGVCLVIEQGRTRIDALRETVERLRSLDDVKVLGAIYNVTQVKRLANYGYYGYGYYAYNYYGYRYKSYGYDAPFEGGKKPKASGK